MKSIRQQKNNQKDWTLSVDTNKEDPTNHQQLTFHDPSFSKTFVTGSLNMREITITVQIKELV